MKSRMAFALVIPLASSAISALPITPAYSAIPSFYESISGTDGSTLTSTGSADSLGFTGNWSMINGKRVQPQAMRLSMKISITGS